MKDFDAWLTEPPEDDDEEEQYVDWADMRIQDRLDERGGKG